MSNNYLGLIKLENRPTSQNILNFQTRGDLETSPAGRVSNSNYNQISRSNILNEENFWTKIFIKGRIARRKNKLRKPENLQDFSTKYWN